MVLKKLTLIVLSSFLILSLSVGIIGLSLQTLLYPDIYITTLEKNDAYDVVEQHLQQEGIITQTIFADEGIRPTVHRFIRSTLAYIGGDEEKWELTVNMSAQSFLEERAAEIEECTPDYDPFSGELCRPPGMEPSEFLNTILEQENIQTTDLSIDLAEVMGIQQSLEQIRSGVQIFRKVIILAFIISLANALFIVILTRTSVISMTEWIDGDLFIVSIMMFIVSIIAKKNISRILPPGLLEGLLSSIAFTVLDLMNFYAMIIIGLGLILIIIAFIVKMLEKVNSR